MNEIKEFINELKLIEEKLILLGGKYNNNLRKEKNKYIFDEQVKCNTEIENTIHLLTHELATELSFRGYRLHQLITFSDFRVKYKGYTNKELSSIIDNENLSIKQKKYIFNGKTIQDYKNIRTEWNTLFKSKKYSKIKESLNV